MSSTDSIPLVTRGAAIGLTIVSVLCVILGAALWQQRQASSAFTHCTAKWQTDFETAYVVRSTSALQVSHAMDRVVRAVDAQDPKAFRAAVRHYLSVRDRQNQQRAAHPLPPLPSVACGS